MYRLKWWQKLLIMTLICVLLGISAWLMLVGVYCGFAALGGQKIGFGTTLISSYGLLVLSLAIIGFSIAGTIFFNKGRKEYKNSVVKNAPQFLKQQDFRKKVLLSFNKLSIPIPSFTFGFESEPIGLFKGTRETYTHILAINKKLVNSTMSTEIVEKDNNTFVGTKPLDALTGGSVVVIGSPGSGKSINIMLPSILGFLQNPAKPSLVITDPKNELYSSSAAVAVKNGYKVVKFDLGKPESSGHWNFLSEIYNLYHQEYLAGWYQLYRMEKITGSKAANAEYRDILAATQTKIAKAKAKIEHLIERYSAFTSTVTGGHNIEFQKKGRSLAGMFMLLPLDLGISKKDYTPYTCAFNADILNFELPLIIEQLPPWALCKTKMGDLKPVSIATTASQNFLQTARGNLSVFLDQDIRDLTQDSTFGLDDVVKQPTVIYIALPAEEINTESETKESASKIARLGSLLCSSLYSAVNNFLAASAKEYLERPLIFMLDELPALGRLDFLEQLFSLGRGKNIFAAPAIQSINQINRIYGESLRKSIFASAAALIVTQIGNDVDTARYLSELSGFVSITKKNYSYGEAGDIKGHSTHEQKEKAVEAAEFTSNQKFGDFFVILQSLKPYKMHTQNFIKSNVWKNFEKEINDFKEPFKVYQAAIDSVNLYTDVLPTISKRLWMYRVKDRLEESKNYQIQFNDLIQAGIKPLNSIELKIINEFIAEHGWLPGFGLEEYIPLKIMNEFIAKFDAVKNIPPEPLPKPVPVVKKQPLKKVKSKKIKTEGNHFVKSKDPVKAQRQLAAIRRKQVEKRKQILKEIM